MKCTICGKPTMPGAMLCTPCRAALKRARYVSVQELPSVSTIGAGRPRKRGRSAAGVGGAGRTETVGSPGLATGGHGRRATSVRWGIAAAAVAALAAAAYIAQPGEAPVRADAAPERPLAVAIPAVAPDAPSPEERVPSRAGTAARPAPGRETAPRREAPTVGAVETHPPAASVPLRSQSPGRDVGLEAFGPSSQATRVAAPLSQAKPAPTAARVPPSPDRWARMREALAACDREGGLSGFVCDQRVRMDGCDGYWGKVPDCPGAPVNPGGQ